jgi:hypothetical protein
MRKTMNIVPSWLKQRAVDTKRLENYSYAVFSMQAVWEDQTDSVRWQKSGRGPQMGAWHQDWPIDSRS